MKKLLILLVLGLQACSHLPETIQYPPRQDIGFAQVQANPDVYHDVQVRWGGTIINVTNQQQNTELQVLLYPLNYYGRPQISKTAEGRFLAVSQQFLDPAIYEKGTEITLMGRLQGKKAINVGKKQLEIPVVAIDNDHIWPVERPYSQYSGNYSFRSGYRYGYGFGYRYRPRYFRYGYYRRGFACY